ncbi:MAG: hypothetical protein IJ087_09935 [Eggerthellaceae bacterium]|nr:hypothetical protein [Eggerthellaceae bacterium]
MKRIAITASLVAILAALAITGCATAQADAPEKPAAEFAYVHDWAEPKEPSGMVRIMQEMQERAQAEQEAAGAALEAEYEYEGGYAEYGAHGGSGGSGYHGNPDGLNSFDGVNHHDGRTETFYSGDNAAYRSELWVDDQGFYRTESGNYAVATSSGDYSKGDTFEGSQGTCEVVDDGAAPGVTDYCVSGWY